MKNFYFDKEIYVISESVTDLAGAIADGVRIVQLRDKRATTTTILRKANSLLALKERYDFTFILNDNPKLAVEIGADGVHIGQDYNTIYARELIGEEMILGKTTHNLAQAQRARQDGVDYISAGPVFATPTKPNRKPVGIAYVEEIANASLPLPFVAIGGIDLTNIDAIIAAGARTIGVVRALPQIKAMLTRVRDL